MGWTMPGVRGSGRVDRVVEAYGDVEIALDRSCDEREALRVQTVSVAGWHDDANDCSLAVRG
ncbi:MAG: hypothetical protein ACRDTD_32045, partial [Pseudonocardiaceae bacterium]